MGANIAVVLVRCYNIPLPDTLPINSAYQAPFINVLGGDLIFVVKWRLDIEMFRDYFNKHGNKDSIIWIITGGEDSIWDTMVSITLNGISAKRDVKYGFDEIRIAIKQGHEKTLLSHYPNATMFAKNKVKLDTKGTYKVSTQEDILMQKREGKKINLTSMPIYSFTPRQKINAFFKEVPYISEKITFLWKGQEVLVLNPKKRYSIDLDSIENIELYKNLVDKYNISDIGSEFYRQFLYKYYDEWETESTNAYYSRYGSTYECRGIESYISSSYWDNCLDEAYLSVLNRTKIQFQDFDLNN